MLQLVGRWGPAVVWAVVLFLLSGQSSPPGAAAFPFPDEVAHLLAYAVLGATLAWAGGVEGATRLPPRRHLALIALGVLYGVTDEWHQSFVPGRDPSLGDLLADAVGTALGYVFFLWLGSRFLARRSPS